MNRLHCRCWSCESRRVSWGDIAVRAAALAVAVYVAVVVL